MPNSPRFFPDSLLVTLLQRDQSEMKLFLLIIRSATVYYNRLISSFIDWNNRNNKHPHMRAGSLTGLLLSPLRDQKQLFRGASLFSSSLPLVSISDISDSTETLLFVFLFQLWPRISRLLVSSPEKMQLCLKELCCPLQAACHTALCCGGMWVWRRTDFIYIHLHKFLL